MDDQACPRCKTTKYRNPSLKLMVNVCGHALCESCVDLLFLKEMDSRARSSPKQFSTLLEFMECHGDLAKPEPGVQGRLRSDWLWQELADILNSIDGGVCKTSDKWKKVWTDWKSKTKKKALEIRRHSSGTGGGPSSRLSLNSMEARVVGLMSASAVEDQKIEEQGFDRPSSATGFDDEKTHSTPSPPPSPEPVVPTTPRPSTSRQLPMPRSPPRPSTSRRQLPMPRSPQCPSTPPTAITPPSSSRPPALSPSPHSSTNNYPHGQHLGARRRRVLTPFARPTSYFVAVERRRLHLDVMRERNEARRIQVEEMRQRNEARRIEVVEEMREMNEARRIQVEEMRERNEARRIEVEHERNGLLTRLADIAQTMLQQYLQSNGSSDGMVLLDVE